MREQLAHVFSIITLPKWQLVCAFLIQGCIIGFDFMFVYFYLKSVLSEWNFLFMLYSYYCTIFFGTVCALCGGKRFDKWLLLLISACICIVLKVSLAIASTEVLVISLINFLGIFTGVLLSGITEISVKNVASRLANYLLSGIFACVALGFLVSSVVIESKSLSVQKNNSTVLLQFKIEPKIIYICSTVIQVLLVYLYYRLWLCRYKDEGCEEDDTAINTGNSGRCKQLPIICSIIGFLVNGIFTTFPYYLFFSVKDSMAQISFMTFSATFLLGRLIYVICCQRKEHNIILSTSFVICGVSICLHSFEETVLISCAFYGFGFSMILPSLTLYLKDLYPISASILVSGYSLGAAFVPPSLALLLDTFGHRFFTSVNFLLLIITVFFFVWLLNIQSNMDKPQGEHAVTIWRFFRGEGALRRTRSIRKFIGSIRGSIRGGRYRRMHGASSPMMMASPENCNNRYPSQTSPHRLSPHIYANRTYRSTQSRSVKTIEREELSSTDTISASTE